MISTLTYMLNELSKYKNDKTFLMNNYILERLNKSYNQYNKELQQSLDYLTTKHEKSILKRIKS